MIFGLAAIPVVAATGVAIDYGRTAMAHSHLTDTLDAAVLAVGSKPAMTDAAATTLVNDWLSAKLADDSTIKDWKIDSLTQKDGKVTVTASANVPTTLTNIIGVANMPISVLSEAIRSVNKLELALVLDTTASMNQPNTKMSGLKTAATSLVNKVTADAKADVKIAVVPYGQYVNIGVANRNQPWVSVPADYSTTKDAYCDPDIKSATICDASTSTKSTCYNDGIPYSCTKTTCTQSHVETYDPPKPGKCYPAKTTNYTFSGCIGSPAYPDNVKDDNPARVYPGYLNLTCTKTFVPLTNNFTTVKNTINSLTPSDPYTYLPSGLAWGFNALSSAVPLTEAAAYDSTGRNLNPAKALVLMTDGFNTVTRNPTTNKSNANFGKHDQSTAPKIATQANTWTAELCANIKAKNIEVYTVAYQLDSSLTGATEAKDMLKACASSANNFYDAADSAQLLAAFGQIAEDLNNLRLTR